MKELQKQFEAILDLVEDIEQTIIEEEHGLVDEALSDIRDRAYEVLLQTKGRVVDGWMSATTYNIYTLEEDDWKHYKRGGCICAARSPSECLCGSWDLSDEELEDLQE